MSAAHRRRRSALARLGLILGGACLLAACQRETRPTPRLADLEAAAGAPVKQFRLDHPPWSWEAIDRDHLLVYTKPGQAWLLDVPGCTSLPFAPAIAITSQLDQVTAGYDRVITGRRDFPCIITRIRPLDPRRLPAAQPRPQASMASPEG
ncbi:MAG: DUF6491 family protein [Fulvimonas sp.]|nr:DUF6491 family protein [Fulvimonas sp.]